MNRFKHVGFQVFIILGLLQIATSPLTGQTPASSQKAYARIHIANLSEASLEILKSYSPLDWWVEADQQLLVLSNRTALQQLKQAYTVDILNVPVDEDSVRFIALDHFRGVNKLDVWPLMDAGRFAVVQERSPLPDYFFHNEHSHAHVLKHQPLVPNTVLSKQWRPKASTSKRMTGKDPLIQSLVNKIDASRWLTTIYCLASYNRYSRGSNIREAEAWLINEFSEIEGLTVRSDPFTFSGTTAYNVIAELPGDGTTEDIFIIGAHYDSISENTNTAAPGAEDNASGTAAVLELARIFAQRPPSARVIFACYSGEEQGLHGSRHQINRLIADNKRDQIKAVLIMDMIGYTGDDDLDTLLETNAVWSDLADTFAQAAATYADLRIVTSFNPFGSDHIPFLQNNVPALLVIENDYSTYPGYHRTNDLPEKIVLAQGYETLKMNVATLATLFDYTFVASLADYLPQWNKTPRPPTIQDLNGNGLIDATELVHIVNMQ